MNESMSETEWRQKAIDMAFDLYCTTSSGHNAYEINIAVPENQRDEIQLGFIREYDKYHQHLASLGNDELLKEIQKQYAFKQQISDGIKKVEALEMTANILK